MGWKRKKTDKNKDKYAWYNKRRKIKDKSAVNVKDKDKSAVNVKENEHVKEIEQVRSQNETEPVKEIEQVRPQPCQSISRKNSLDKALKFLTRTEIARNMHKACVCVICDTFIVGVEKIYWLSVDQLLSKESYLSVKFVESTTGKIVPIGLRNQYKINNCDRLSHLLLSPRAHVKDLKKLVVFIVIGIL